ncbi:dioxygenase [Bifidobacterium sp. ESL0763]|uniref:dioxygenase n=1 Tax=Bifidobacterium sp. ESL0763 TaxID=2983227 RepID=UPI0023F9D4E2|nr:dioxygenase [Bifidobacterium sp. ESL0763]MDF7663540.1 dioxygenase [Bifidobacterium sp. ESL0763]
MMERELSNLPEALPIENPLGSVSARVPEQMELSSGVVLEGRRLRSFAYTTDVAVIHNTNADAILAVYPFTGQPVINQAVLSVARSPVFVGVGGGTTTGTRVLELAVFAEMQGVSGVVLNAPSTVEIVREVAMTVHVPVMATVVRFDDDVARKIEAGARIVNVAAGRRTAEVVAQVKQRYPEIPLVASSGGSAESIRETIAAGANALTWTPPSAASMQKAMMERYRNGEAAHTAPVSGGGAAASRASGSPAATSKNFYTATATMGHPYTDAPAAKSPSPRHKKQSAPGDDGAIEPHGA